MLCSSDGSRNTALLLWQLHAVNAALVRDRSNVSSQIAALTGNVEFHTLEHTRLESSIFLVLACGHFSLVGMAKIAGVATDEAALVQVLAAHLQQMNQEFSSMTAAQQAAMHKQV